MKQMMSLFLALLQLAYGLVVFPLAMFAVLAISTIIVACGLIGLLGMAIWWCSSPAYREACRDPG